MVSLAGLSQKDVVLSRRAEEQLEQEKLDQEIARRLQQQIDIGAETEDDKLAREAQDLEYAKMLHAKDKAKIKRAKERSKQKKLLQQQQEQLPDGAVAGPRADSRTSRNSRNGHTPQHSFDEAAEPRIGKYSCYIIFIFTKIYVKLISRKTTVGSSVVFASSNDTFFISQNLVEVNAVTTIQTVLSLRRPMMMTNL